MPTKQTTTSTNQYNPQGMSAYNQLTPAWSQQAQQFIKNPYGNPQFQLDQQLGTRQAQGIGGTGISNILHNQTASGFGGGANSPYMQEMLANQSRANSGLQAQLGFINPMQNALQRQMGSMQMAEGYQPLQTGNQQVKSTSGVGTWLPQVAALAMAPFTGGLSLGALGGAGGLLGGLFGQANQAQTQGMDTGSFNSYLPQIQNGNNFWSGSTGAAGMPGNSAPSGQAWMLGQGPNG